MGIPAASPTAFARQDVGNANTPAKNKQEASTPSQPIDMSIEKRAELTSDP
jgi:hypothetical protein